jgi:hypothetical protein
VYSFVVDEDRDRVRGSIMGEIEKVDLDRSELTIESTRAIQERYIRYSVVVGEKEEGARGGRIAS